MSKKEGPLFRYLEKYVGKYRVKSHYDEELNDFPRNEEGNIDPSYDEMYIVAFKGEVKSTYKAVKGKGTLLCWYTDSAQQGHNVYNELKSQYPDMWMLVDECSSYDYFIYFEETDLDNIMKVVGYPVSGKGIHPYSVKNLVKSHFEIPEEDAAKYDVFVANLSQTEKMQFGRKMIKGFLETECTKKMQKEFKESNMPGKEFIYSKGMWNKYITYIKSNA